MKAISKQDNVLCLGGPFGCDLLLVDTLKDLS